MNDEDIRAEAAAALGSVAKPEDKAAIAALRSILENKKANRNKQLRQAAQDSLKKLTGETVKPKKK
jgi:hypothetical protein